MAERIADILRAIEPPFTISLSGSWGVGKTSLVEEVERRLPGARIVLVDAWIGRLYGARVVYVESFTRIEGPSLSCRMIAPVAERVYAQWPELARAMPAARYEGSLFEVRT